MARARWLVVLVACAALGAAPTRSEPARAARSSQAVPASAPSVLIELFTSEGCEACPPADEILIDLVRKQPVPGVRVIALGEHVDYWDQGGWKDPFSSAAFSRRQTDYAGALNSDVYTPQLVIDGRTAVIGSNRGAVIAAIRSAAAKPKAGVSLAWAPAGTRDLQVTVPAAPMLADCRVFIAITEDHLSNQVKRGENAGKELRHDAVTRRMKVLGSTDATGAFSQLVPVGPMLDQTWKPDALHVVVFVQNTKGLVLALATNSLQPTTDETVK